MKQWIIFVTILAAVPASLCAGADPLRLLILTGRHNHDWQATTPVLERMYEESGLFTVDVTEDPAGCDGATLAKYDVIVDNWAAYPDMTGRQWGPTMESALLDFVRNGKGFVLLHAATACFADWPEFDTLAGCAWRDTAGHSAIHRFKVTIEDTEHPVTKGMTDFITGPDELYHRLTPQPTMHVLCTAFSAKEKRGTGEFEPAAVCTEYGQGRCFYNVLGHDVRAMQGAGFRALMLRGTEWAAAGEVTIPPPDPVPLAIEGIVGYKFGQSRKGLLLVEDVVHNALNSPGERARLEEALLGVLGSEATRECREFVCKQLSLIGTEQAVPALAALLTHEELADMARYALERIPGPAVDEALRNALGQATGLAKVGLLNTLGERGDPNSVQAVAGALDDTDAAVAAAAIAALGKIGGEAALEALAQSRFPDNAVLQEATARSKLMCADQFLAQGAKDKAGDAYAAVFDAESAREIRGAAFRGLVAARPGEAPSLVADVLGRDEADLTAIALRVARQVPGSAATEAFAALLPTLPAQKKALLLRVLQDRCDPLARAAVVAAAKDEDASVRVAALRALACVGDATTVPPVAQTAAAADGAERDAARHALARLAGPDVNAAILGGVKEGPGGIRVELIRCLAARNATEAVPALLGTARDPDAAVRDASLVALAAVARKSDMSALVKLLMQPEDEADRKAAEKMVVAVARRVGDVTAVLDAYPQAQGVSVKCSLLRVLGDAGDARALNTLRLAQTDAAAPVQDAAIRALAAWPSPEPVYDLLNIARAASDQTHRVLALRALVRLLALPSDRAVEETLGLYAKAMETAEKAEARKQVLAGLASVAHPEALKMVEGYLGDAEVGKEAAMAALKIADALSATHPDQAEASLQKLVETAQDEGVIGQARGILVKAKLKKLESQNLALGAVASSPDDLDKDGGAGGDQAAIDGNPDTYWDEVDRKGLYVLEVAFEEAQEVSAISILGHRHHDYAPKDFEVVCDGQAVTSVQNAQYTENLLFVGFPKVSCKTLQLRITGYYGQSPAIRELGIYNAL